MKCAIPECTNRKLQNTEKYFFCCPRAEERRQLWMKLTLKVYHPKTYFLVCEDHFDMRNDLEYYRINGTPVLKASVYPHRNLTLREMTFQKKLDSINWTCFVPSCENKRLMTDKNVVFFSVPEGLEGELWRDAVSEERISFNSSSIDEPQFCCEEHFDITTDLERTFNSDSSVEYKIKTGVLPSLNLNDSKEKISNEVKVKHLCDSISHPRVILNNDISYLYDAKLPLLIAKLQPTDNVAFVNVVDVKTEPMDTGYEYEHEYEPEIYSEIVIKKEEPDFDLNPLDFESKSVYESKPSPESDSSISNKGSDYDPDVTTDDLVSTDDDSISDDSFEQSDPDTAERFECCHCKQMVKHLEQHVERVHWNFSKNVNRTQCGLCLEKFPHHKDLKKHQTKAHDGNAFKCDICDYSTQTHEAIRIHILRSHSNERRMLCQHCGKTYKFNEDLRRHVRNTHMNIVRERKHECHVCNKTFFIRGHMTRHINTVHLKLQSYQCNVDGCNKAFNRKWYLKTHQTQVHAKQNHHSCIICGKTFSFKGNLTVHIKKIHKI